MKPSVAIIGSLIFAALVQLSSAIAGDPISKQASLEQRVARGDDYAFIEAANAGRKDLMPSIERFSDDNTAKKALAKLGEKKYLEDIVADLTSTNSTTFEASKRANEEIGMGKENAEKEAELATKGKAFDALVYIADKSTLK